MDVY
jgi:hypothetical protein